MAAPIYCTRTDWCDPLKPVSPSTLPVVKKLVELPVRFGQFFRFAKVTIVVLNASLSAPTVIGICIGLLLPVRSASFAALISRIVLLLLAACSFLSSRLLLQLESFLSLGFNFAMVFALAVFMVTINRLGIAYLQYPGQARPHQFKIIDESIRT